MLVIARCTRSHVTRSWSDELASGTELRVDNLKLYTIFQTHHLREASPGPWPLNTNRGISDLRITSRGFVASTGASLMLRKGGSGSITLEYCIVLQESDPM